jgi:acetylornithine deacetylase
LPSPKRCSPTGAGLHGTDEYVTVDSLLTTAKVLASTMIDYCGVRSGQ